MPKQDLQDKHIEKPNYVCLSISLFRIKKCIPTQKNLVQSSLLMSNKHFSSFYFLVFSSLFTRKSRCCLPTFSQKIDPLKKVVFTTFSRPANSQERSGRRALALPEKCGDFFLIENQQKSLIVFFS